MTTNYGARPGLEPQGGDTREARTVEPRTMSAERETEMRRTADMFGEDFCISIFAELDAERAAHGATLAALNGLARKSMRAWRYAMADGVAEVAGIQPEHREAMAILGWRPGGKCFTCGRLWNIRNVDGCPDCQ